MKKYPERNKYLFFPEIFSIAFFSSMLFIAMSFFILEETQRALPLAISFSLWILPFVFFLRTTDTLISILPSQHILFFSNVFHIILLFTSLHLLVYSSDIMDSIYLLSLSMGFYTLVISRIATQCDNKLFYKNLSSKATLILNYTSLLATTIGFIVGGVLYSIKEIEFFIYSVIFSTIIFMILCPIFHFIPGYYTTIKRKEIFNCLNITRKEKKLFTPFFIGIIINSISGVLLLIPVPYIIFIFFGFYSIPYGIIFSFFPLGLVTSKFLSKKINFHHKRLHLLFYLLTFSGILIILPLFFKTNKIDNFFLSSIGTFLFSFAVSTGNRTINNHLKKTVPEELKKPFTDVYTHIILISLILSLLFGGMIVDKKSVIHSISSGLFIYSYIGIFITVNSLLTKYINNLSTATKKTKL